MLPFKIDTQHPVAVCHTLICLRVNALPPLLPAVACSAAAASCAACRAASTSFQFSRNRAQHVHSCQQNAVMLLMPIPVTAMQTGA